MYITHAQLAERPGARELAEVATAQHEALVPYELMQAALTGASRSAWTVDENARADEALLRIDEAVTNAGGVIDGFLARRGYLPLNPVPDIVVVWCRSIARYFLHQDRLSTEDKDPIVRDYKDTMKLLQLTADGKFFLGADDMTLTDQSLDVQFESSPSVFNRSQLNSFR